MKKKTFSIIMPIYGNEKNLPITIPYVMEHLNLFEEYKVELVMVCDGSPDNSYEIMKEFQQRYPQTIKIAKFTRNFGQGSAVNCGIQMSNGDAIGVISADLQDPLELFVDMLKAWKEGYKFVIATRKKRPEKGIGGWASKTWHKLVHKFINNDYPKGGFDFYLMDREMADMYVSVDAPNGSMQLLMLWLGYKHKVIEYERRERTEGKSTWNFKRKINLAIAMFINYSFMPLRIFLIPAIIFGILALASLVIGVVSLVATNISGGLIALGFCALAGGIAALFLAIVTVGEYIWRIQELVKPLPRFVVEESINEIEQGEKE